MAFAATGAASPFPWASAQPPLSLGASPELPLWPYVIQLVLVTFVLAAVGLYGVRYLRQRFPNLQLGLGLGGASGLKVVDRLALDPQRSLFIVSVGKRSWLLAATTTHVTTVAELAPEDLAAPDFAGLVAKEVRSDEHAV